jgi:hypothetical protein
VGLQALLAHSLDHAQALAELGQGADQRIERAVGDELLAAAEVGHDALPDLSSLSNGLDDLQVLVRGAGVRAALDAYEHAETIAAAPRCARPRSSILGTTFQILDTSQCRNPAIFLNPAKAEPRKLSKMSLK